MAQQPYYTIDFSASACMFEIRVNDIAVITLEVEGQAATMLPINYAILKSGKQDITATILPLHGNTRLENEAELKYNIRLFDVINGFEFLEEQPGHQFPKIEKEKSLPALAHATFFEASISYKVNGWLDGKPLKDIDDINAKLFLAYNDVANMLRNNQFDLFAKKIENREKRMCTSMYLSDAEAKDRLKSIEDDCNAGFKVEPMPKNALMVLYGNGKVATLKRPTGESALYLTNKETGEELAIDISFYIPEGKTEFEVI
jgi:hypothetical protein